MWKNTKACILNDLKHKCLVMFSEWEHYVLMQNSGESYYPFFTGRIKHTVWCLLHILHGPMMGVGFSIRLQIWPNLKQRIHYSAEPQTEDSIHPWYHYHCYHYTFGTLLNLHVVFFQQLLVKINTEIWFKFTQHLFVYLVHSCPPFLLISSSPAALLLLITAAFHPELHGNQS